MPTQPQFPVVDLVVNDDPVDEGLNRPLIQLRQRTDYLLSLLQAAQGGGVGTSIRIPVSLDESDPAELYECVYMRADGLFVRTATNLLSFDGTDPLVGNGQHVVGFIVAKASVYEATVILAGSWTPSTPLLATDVLETGEVFVPGPHYLSFQEAGRLTSNPRGARVLVGVLAGVDTDISHILVGPYVQQDGTSHRHIRVPMVAQPAGINSAFNDGADRHRVIGFDPLDYLSGGANEGEVPPYRLRAIGTAGLTSTRTYTIWIDSQDDTFLGARVYWSTSDGLDDTIPGQEADVDYGSTVGVPLVAYNTPTTIGSLGVQVVLEPGYDIAVDVPDFAAFDFSNVPTLALPLDEVSWELVLPRDILGWQPYLVQAVGSYTGDATDFGYTVRAYGKPTNSEGSLNVNFVITVDTVGSLDTGTAVLRIEDDEGNLLDTWSSAEFGVAMYSQGLWFYITPYTADDPATGTTVVADDAWSLTAVDPAPGALFRYNMEADAAPDAYYPTAPRDAITFTINGIIMALRGVVDAGVGSYTPGTSTIYWFHDAAQELPFPLDQVSPALPGAEQYYMESLLYFALPSMNGGTQVTSLQPAPGSGVVITQCGTDTPASSGALAIDVSVPVSGEVTNLPGFQVFKEAGPGGSLLAGPVVEKLLAGTGITLSSQNPSFPGQGTVRISSSAEGLLDGEFTDITMRNSKITMVPDQLFSFIELLGFDSESDANIFTGFIAKMRVPMGLTAKYRMAVYATVFGREAVAVAVNPQDTQYFGLTFTYSVLPDLVSIDDPATPAYVSRNLAVTGPTGVLKVETPMAADVPLGKTGEGYNAYDPILVHNDAEMATVEGQVTPPFQAVFPVAEDDPLALTAGDLVAIRFDRTAPVLEAHQGSPDEYVGAIGFINLRWRLIEVEG